MGLTEDARAVWLAIRGQGGWWTVKQTVANWHPTFAEWEIEQILRDLTAAGFLISREMAPGMVAYAFTSECRLLPGINGKVAA